MALSPRAQEIVDAVAGMISPEARSYLDRACADAALRREVEDHLAMLAECATEERLPGATKVPAAPTRALGHLQPGDTVGGFHLEAVLGAGGFGVVYRARDADGRAVAFKTVKVPQVGLLHGIRREVHALSRLRHPGIVPIVAEGLHDGIPWYAMTLLAGEPLRATAPGLDADGRPTLAGHELVRRLTLVRRLCAPLAYLHGEGLVHRDLKPDNVVVTTGRRPVLIDFGLTSSALGRHSRETLEVAGLTVGTIFYMSPEQGRGDLVDARSDLYALGCILYELLTGRPPFRGDGSEVLAAHQEEVPPPPSERVAGVPPALDAVVMRLLAKEPRTRYGYAADVGRALVGLGAEEDGGARGPVRIYLYRPELAGRAREIDQARTAIRRMRRGQGRLLLLLGETGIGKTRLAREIGRESVRAGASVLLGECLPEDRSPLLAFRRTLQAVADRCRELGGRETVRLLGERGAVLAQYEPAIAAVPGIGSAAPVPLPPVEARTRLVVGLAETLGALASSMATTLLLDDLQWLDALSLAAIRSLVTSGRLAESRLLLVGTCRRDEAPDELVALFDHDDVSCLALDSLSTASVGGIVMDMLALDAPPAELVDALARQSAGNPLFVAEFLRAAIDDGALRRDDDGQWRLTDSGQGRITDGSVPLPQSVGAILERRIDRLDTHARQLLLWAAVLGTGASLDLLLTSPDQTEPAALEAQQELLRRHVLAEDGDRVAFTHIRISDAVRARADPESRRHLHWMAAEAIERLHGDTPEHAAALGHHWHQAGEGERARRHYLLAAGAALERHAHDEAERLLVAYLSLVETPDAESLEARQLLVAGVLQPTGRMAEAEREARRALDESRALGSDSSEALAQHALGAIARMTGRTDQARHHLETAYDIYQRLGDRLREGSMLGELGNLARETGRLDEADTLFQASMALHREVGYERGVRTTSSNIATLRRDQGRLEEALDLHLGEAAAAEELPVQECVALTSLGSTQFDLGRIDDARSSFERALDLARRVGMRAQQGLLHGNLANVLVYQGHHEQALHHYRTALSLSQEVGSRRDEANTLSNMAHLLVEIGRPHEAREPYARAVAIARETGARGNLAWTVGGLGYLLLLLEGPAAARAPIVEALELAREVGNGRIEGFQHVNLGRAALAAGDKADGHLAAARACAERTGSGSESQLAARIEALARAIVASREGRPLLGGLEPEELSAPLRAWLVRARDAARS